MRKIRKMLALVLALSASAVGLVATAPEAAAQGVYVGWAANYGCDSDGLHWRFTEHAMYNAATGQPDHKRFYLDVLNNGNMIHQNAYHGWAPFNVFPAAIMHINYPFVHNPDPLDWHHCRFVLARWGAGGHVGQQITGDGGNDGFYAGSIGHFLMNGGQPVGSWTETSNWVLSNQDCRVDPYICQWNYSTGSSAYWWNQWGTYADGTNQGDLWAEAFVDGL